MAETRFIIREDLRPAYYDDFHCIMGACQYNCCDDGWNIQFNKQEYLKVKYAPKSPELEELCGKCLRRLRDQGHDGLYGEFRASEAGRCAFHTPEGLCRLQLECGEETLPYVCRVFPRMEKHMPSGYLERTLSPGCEGVLALLWDLAEGEEDIERWMERTAALPDSVGASIKLPDGDQELSMCLNSCLYTLMNIKTKDAGTNALQAELMNNLKPEFHRNTIKLSGPPDSYRKARAQFEEQFSGQDHFMENLMVAVFFHLYMPNMSSREDLWKSYVNFCNLYGFFRFLAVMSCREGASGNREELFRLTVFASRVLLHKNKRQDRLRDEFFKNDSATLTHMAILLCG